MKYAIQKSAGNLHVSAFKAKRSIAYICPVCSTSVSVRAGRMIDPYFAHMPGRGSRDCELYFYSEYTQHNSDEDYSSGVLPELGIEIQISDFDPPRGWTVYLNLPLNKVNRGKIIVAMNDRIQTINLTGNVESQRKIIVDPQSNPYLIECIPNEGLLPTFLNSFCEALKPMRATVFGEIKRFGNETFSLAKNLKVNCTYIFIWKNNSHIDFPSELIIESLIDRSEWQGSLVTIPDKVNYTTHIWLEEFSDLKLIDTNPSLTPIWPPLIKNVTARRTATIYHERIIFCLSGIKNKKENYKTKIILDSEKKQTTFDVDFPKNHPKFLNIAACDESELQISCSEVTTQIEVDYTLMIQDFNFPTVIMEGSNINGDLIKIPLHDSNGHDFLQDVRANKANLLSLIFPHGCNGRILMGKNGLWEIEEILNESGKQAADAVVARLQQKDFDFLIDFGALGQMVLIAEKILPNTLMLEPKLRLIIRSYLTTLPIKPRWPVALGQLEDSALIEAFLAAKPLAQTITLYMNIQRKLNSISVSQKEH